MILEGLKESGRIAEFDRLRNKDFVRINLDTATTEELRREERFLVGALDDNIRELCAVRARIEEVKAGELQAAADELQAA